MDTYNGYEYEKHNTMNNIDKYKIKYTNINNGQWQPTTPVNSIQSMARRRKKK